MHRPLWKDLILLAAKSVTTIITTLLLIVFGAGTISAVFDNNNHVGDGSCNIAVLPIEGIILPFAGMDGFDFITTPATVDSFIQAAENDTSIEGILVEINSPGGTPVASHRIAEKLYNTGIPSVGLIGDIGASGGYMAAAATDFLIASPMSDVGSIGVNMSYVENSKQNEAEGITYVQLMTGKFKDIGTPNRPITDEERKLLQNDLDIIHNEFIDIVAKYRNLDRQAVSLLADGASMPGRRALESQLVDALGDRTQAKAALAGMLDTLPAEIHFCEYERSLLLI